MSTEATEVTTQTNAETPKAAAPQVDPGVQKRINELTRARYDQQRRAEAAEARLAELEKASKPAAPPAEAEKRKTLADFGYDEAQYDDYLEQRAVARAEAAAAKKAEQVVEARETKKAQETTAAERQKNWSAKVTEFTKSHPDFVEVVYADHVFTDIPDALVETILDSTPELAYHLAQNPEELSRISRLSPAAAGRELGKLEAKLSSEKPAKDPEETASAEPPVKLATKAPPPAPKIEATESVTRKAWNDPALSQEEFNKRRREYSSKRR